MSVAGLWIFSSSSTHLSVKTRSSLLWSRCFCRLVRNQTSSIRTFSPILCLSVYIRWVYNKLQFNCYLTFHSSSIINCNLTVTLHFIPAQLHKQINLVVNSINFETVRFTFHAKASFFKIFIVFSIQSKVSTLPFRAM